VSADADSAPKVVIVNEALAQRLWPGQNAVGKHVTRTNNRDYEVVGVVATTKIRSIGEDPRTGIYFPQAQLSTMGVWYLARTTGNADQLAQSMLRAVQSMDPEIILLDARTMARHLEVIRLPMRLAALVIGALAMLAVVLAGIGLYGTVRYAVAQRTREVGIRLALGADSRAMVRLLMRDGLRLVVWGSVVGLALALLLARLVSRLLFGVPALDPVTFLAVPVLLFGIASAAAWLPARRVVGVAPTEALRSEG
jgi:putative ABC transport system permease protein